MNSQEIAEALKLTGKLLELHQENPFKVRSVSNAAFRISKSGVDLMKLSQDEIEALEGIGKGIAGKIKELKETGTTAELDQLLKKTPPGVVRLMDVKGLGPKKVATLWKEMGVESIGELLYACKENRLITLKGFGEKTQAEVKKNIEYLLANEGSFHYAVVEPVVQAWTEKLKRRAGCAVEPVGEVRRKLEVITSVDFLACTDKDWSEKWEENGIKFSVESIPPAHFYAEVVKRSASKEFLDAVGKIKDGASVKEVFKNSGLAELPPEYLESAKAAQAALSGKVPALIEWKDLKGCLHNHSTWSDGLNSIKQMALACQELGLHYFGICDHSRTAAYAGGLSIEQVHAQHEEVDHLNKELKSFRILKGIESDILSDGSLDYPVEVLKTFDLVVASVHQNLKMDEAKATERLIKAIENPYTNILGHPTGRLLLSRPGYPLHFIKVIDACAANGVAIELNAHPWRLDIDWRWIETCMDKGVMVSINPDAHEVEGIKDMMYGIYAARKGGLTSQSCLNALPLPELMKFLKKN